MHNVILTLYHLNLTEKGVNGILREFLGSISYHPDN